MSIRLSLLLAVALLPACKSETPEAPPPLLVAEQKTTPPVTKKAPEVKAPTTKAAPAAVASETFVGHVKALSNKARTLKVANKTGSIVVGWDANTKLVDAEAFKDLKPPTKITVKYTPGAPAVEIKRMLVKIPADMLIETPDIAKLLTSKTPYTLVDARPKGRYLEGHIPSAIHIFANELEANLNKLPKDKGQLVIFYCGGVTCGLSPKSAKLAKAKGWTNVKAYRDGLPGWKKTGHHMVVEPMQIKAKLGPNAVFIDLRADASTRVKGAVHFTLADFKKLDASLAAVKRPRLPGVTDTKAPIIIYGAKNDDADAIALWKALKGWGYKSHALLNGGFAGWTAAKLPLDKGAAPTTFTYVRKAMPGSVNVAEFEKAMASKSTIIVDVRTADEAADKLAGAINVPLDSFESNLAKLPKGKAIILYCGSGSRASMGYETLKKKGYTQVRYLDDMYTEIKRPKTAAPTAAPKGEEAEGC
jgi:rhodanese-related sulfurtransferase